MQQYQKKATQSPVIAVQLNIELTDGKLGYQKWGGDQSAKQRDWIVNNGGEVYTIKEESFANTYTKVGEGQYMKTATVWAEKQSTPGMIKTKEGITHYARGDYLVYNDEDLTDGYAVQWEKFAEMYEPVS